MQAGQLVGKGWRLLQRGEVAFFLLALHRIDRDVDAGDQGFQAGDASQGNPRLDQDPEYPEERQAYMLEDSGVELLLSQSHLKLPLAQGVQRIDLDRGAPWFEDYSEANPDIHLDGENLAYVIYTSGSTGKPKGAGNLRWPKKNSTHCPGWVDHYRLRS